MLTPASAADYQDWWWNPAQSGMGLNVGHQGNMLAVSWYLYGSDGKGEFLLFTGPLNGNQMSGSLYRYTGPLPGPGFSPNQVSANAVGSATITFTSDSTAVMAYNYDGRSGQLNLERFSFASRSISGTYVLGMRVESTGCQDPEDNGTFFGLGLATITPTGPQSFRAVLNAEDGSSCTLNATYAQKGSTFEGSGTFSCASWGTAGNWSFRDMRFGPDLISFKSDTQTTSGDTCREATIVTGIRY